MALPIDPVSEVQICNGIAEVTQSIGEIPSIIIKGIEIIGPPAPVNPAKIPAITPQIAINMFLYFELSILKLDKAFHFLNAPIPAEIMIKPSKNNKKEAGKNAFIKAPKNAAGNVPIHKGIYKDLSKLPIT